MKVTVGGTTDVGRVRSRNEDAYLTLPEDGLVFVADGLGGHQAGDVASSIAVQRLRELVGDGGQPSDADLVDWLYDIHGRILADAAADPDHIGMGTTAVVASLPADGDTASVVHVGDSRAYLRRDDELAQVTADHADPGRSFITQALGIGEIAPETSHVTLDTGDQLLLCTDGLTDMIADAEVDRLLGADGDAQQLCDDLIAAALERGGVDNVTVVLAVVG